MVTGSPDHTKPSKMEIYLLVNNTIIKKWQSQSTQNNKGRHYHYGQPNVKTHCDIYSTSRRLDTVYKRLRLGHCGRGYQNCSGRPGLCPSCRDPEDLEHLFFECEAHTEHRWGLAAAIFKLGYIK